MVVQSTRKEGHTHLELCPFRFLFDLRVSCRNRVPHVHTSDSRRTRLLCLMVLTPAYHDDASDSDEPVVQTRRTKRHKTNSGNGNANTNQLIDLPDEADATPNYLYDALCDSESSLTELARGWIESYEENSTFAIRDFVNMILRLAGCHDVIETHDIEEGDSAAATVAQLQDHVRNKSAAQYPWLTRNRRTNFCGTISTSFCVTWSPLPATRTCSTTTRVPRATSSTTCSSGCLHCRLQSCGLSVIRPL